MTSNQIKTVIYDAVRDKRILSRKSDSNSTFYKYKLSSVYSQNAKKAQYDKIANNS